MVHGRLSENEKMALEELKGLLPSAIDLSISGYSDQKRGGMRPRIPILM
jgi:hypothetical protein